MNIEHRLDSGDLPDALRTTQALLQRCQVAGETAYEGADYDLAYAQWLIEQVLHIHHTKCSRWRGWPISCKDKFTRVLSSLEKLKG